MSLAQGLREKNEFKCFCHVKWNDAVLQKISLQQWVCENKMFYAKPQEVSPKLVMILNLGSLCRISSDFGACEVLLVGLATLKLWLWWPELPQCWPCAHRSICPVWFHKVQWISFHFLFTCITVSSKKHRPLANAFYISRKIYVPVGSHGYTTSSTREFDTWGYKTPSKKHSSGLFVPETLVESPCAQHRWKSVEGKLRD